MVTGAAGFIGRNVVAELNARGRTDLLLVDQLGSGDKWKNLLGLRFDDLINPAQFLDMIESGKTAAPDAVIHLGASSATTERDGDFLLKNNYQYTRALCEDSATLNRRPLNMYGYSKHL